MELSLPLFDSIAANLAGERGMDAAAKANAERLRTAQAVAKEIGRRIGYADADMVQHELIMRHHFKDGELGNAAGSIFRGKDWEYHGKTVKSQRPASHGRLIRVWVYVGE